MAYFMLYLPLQIIITHLITPFEKTKKKRRINRGEDRGEVSAYKYETISSGLCAAAAVAVITQFRSIVARYDTIQYITT